MQLLYIIVKDEKNRLYRYPIGLPDGVRMVTQVDLHPTHIETGSLDSRFNAIQRMSPVFLSDLRLPL